MYVQKIVFILMIFLLTSCGTDFHKNIQPTSSSIYQFERVYTRGNFFINKEKCYKEKDFDMKYIHNLNSLFKHISKGDIYSFDIGLSILHCMDGGALGDIYRSFGEFFEKRPQYFIKAVNQHETLNTKLKKIFTTLPLSTVDNLALKIEILKIRISILSEHRSIMNPDKYYRALSFLEKSLAFYSRRNDLEQLK